MKKKIELDLIKDVTNQDHQNEEKYIWTTEKSKI